MLGLGRKKDDAQPTGATTTPASGSTGATRMTRAGRKAAPQPAPAQQTVQDEAHVARPGAKNRPTPTRREQQAARRHLVVDPDRKGAAARNRATSREDARSRQRSFLAGEEWALPERDRGVFRRYVRDYVDARWSIGEALLPLVFLTLVLSWLFQVINSDALYYVMFVLTYGTFAAAIIDAFVAYRRLRRRFEAAHPGTPVPSGSGLYAGMRMMQIRRFRAPRPQVARGEFPR